MVAERLEEVPFPDLELLLPLPLAGLGMGLVDPDEPLPIAGIGYGDAAYAGVVEDARVHDDVGLGGGLRQGMVPAEGEDEAALRDV